LTVGWLTRWWWWLAQAHRGTDGFRRVLIAWTLLLTLGVGYTLWSAQRDTSRRFAERGRVVEQSLQQMRGDVTRCFLSPGRLRPAQVAECAAEFDDPETPANDYREVQAGQRRNLNVFGDLRRRVAELERKAKEGGR
jgi:hypothetical protein